MAEIDVICVDSDGDTEETAVIISDTEEDIIFVLKKDSLEIDLTREQELPAHTQHISELARQQPQALFDTSNQDNNLKPGTLVPGGFLKNDHTSTVESVNRGEICVSDTLENFSSDIGSDGDSDSVPDETTDNPKKHNCDNNYTSTGNENETKVRNKDENDPILSTAAPFCFPYTRSADSPNTSDHSTLSPRSLCHSPYSPCMASDSGSASYSSDSDINSTNIDSSDNILSPPAYDCLVNIQSKKNNHKCTRISPSRTAQSISHQLGHSGSEPNKSIVTGSEATVEDSLSITPAATPMFDKLIESPQRAACASPSQHTGYFKPDALSTHSLYCDSILHPPSHMMSDKSRLSSQIVDHQPTGSSKLNSQIVSTVKDRSAGKLTSSMLNLFEKQKFVNSESSIPPKKRKINTVDIDYLGVVSVDREKNGSNVISDDSEDDLEIVELAQTAQVETTCSLIEEHDECSICERVVLLKDLLHCGCKRTCCAHCLEKQVTNLLAKGEKGLPMCGAVDCDLLFQLEKLSGFLPSMVMSILRKKIEEETIGDIMEWLKPQKLEQEKSNVERALELPNNWELMHECQEYISVNLQTDNPEYIEVQNLFHLTMHNPRAQIKSITRVQNPSLWRFYAMKRYEMNKDISLVHPEQQLFHGTRREHTDAICRENFDWRMSGVHGTVYGQGSYFARDSSYSHRYTDPPLLPDAMSLPSLPARLVSGIQSLYRPLNLSTKSAAFPFPALPPHLQAALPTIAMPTSTAVSASTSPSLLTSPSSQSGHILYPSKVMSSRSDPMLSQAREQSPKHPTHIHCMFLARVLIGRYTAGKPSYRKPPPIDENNAKCYDSCVNSVYNPTIYVVFDKSQCYPEYLIEYTNVPHWQ